MHALIIALLLAIACAAQETPLGDLARQERARREAAESVNFRLGSKPPAAHEGEVIPAHFLTVKGDAAEGEFSVKLNGAVVFHNSYVRDLPIYVSSLLLDGGNILEISLNAGRQPVDVTIDERRVGQTQLEVLARFHADGSETPAEINKQVRFVAHPKMLPPLVLTDADRTAIRQLVDSFYDALNRRDSKQVLALFDPAIDEARELYPEGADFGRGQMLKMAQLVAANGFVMQPFNSTSLEMIPRGATVMVRRSDGQPVFSSTEVDAPGGGKTSVSAESILAKKIKGQWRLTLPFGF
jgi:hypothetical protein